MIVNQTPYPISFEMKTAQALTCRYGEVGRQYKFIADIDLTGLSANLQVIKPDGTFVIEEATVTVTENKQYIVVEIPLQATVVKGVCRYDINLFQDEDLILYTAEGPLWVDDKLITEDLIESVAEVYGLRFPQDFLTVENLVDIVHYVEAEIIKDNAIAEDTTWSSQKIEQEISGVTPDIDVSKTVTGNPIEITDAAAAPLVRCITQITGYQEGTGTPSPDNIRPIVAYTEGEIEVGGRNIANPSVYKQDYVLTSDGSENSATDYCITNRVHVDANTVYTCSLTLKPGGTDTLRLGFYDENMNFISRPTVRNESFTTPVNAYWLRLSYNNVNPDLTNIMIVKGSVPYSYEPYTSTTHTTTFPSAIYRGSEDVVNGEVTSEMPVIDLGDLSWSAYKTDTTGHSFYVNVPTGVKSVSSDSSVANMVCENYETVAFINLSEWLRRDAIICQVPNAQRWIVRDERYSDATAFTTAMNGVQLAYELATPTTSSVTPTNLPIKSLSGYNHIESSTGDMEVEYIRDTYQPLVDLIQSSSHVYSTAEQVVGKWIDGSTVYEKTVHIENTTSVFSDYINGAEIANVNLPISMNFVAVRNDIFMCGNGCNRSEQNANYMVAVRFRNGYIQYRCDAYGTEITDIYVTIRYTKTI